MKLIFALMAAIFVGGFLGGIPLYMTGRILCPEVGIPVPPFGACYWVAFWVTLFTVAAVALHAFIDELVS